MRTFVIGDVHGMVDELEALHYKLEPEPGDRWAFLGDYVNKGPRSLEALHMVRMLVSQYPGSVAIAGNHEEAAMSLYTKAQKQGNWDGLRKAVKEPWLKEMSQSDYDWMRSLPLIARPVDGIILIHGGMSPRYFEKHDEIGDVPAAWHKGGGKRMNRMRRFLRIRHVYREDHEKAGQMVSLGDEGVNTQPWHEWYDGREGFAFYGHAPQKNGEPLVSAHAMGLDTGAVFGGKLTAAVLHHHRPRTKARVGRYCGRVAGLHCVMVAVESSRAYTPWLEAFEAD